MISKPAGEGILIPLQSFNQSIISGRRNFCLRYIIYGVFSTSYDALQIQCRKSLTWFWKHVVFSAYQKQDGLRHFPTTYLDWFDWSTYHFIYICPFLRHLIMSSWDIHWKPDIRIPFIPEENGLICSLFLYEIHTVDKLHDLVLGRNILIQ